MNFPRSALLIAIRILELIPENTEKNESFRTDLTNLVTQDFAYRSPELLTHPSSWIRLESVLRKNISNLDETWKADIVDVYNGQIAMKMEGEP
jgi:hypothetical protein